MPNDYYKNMARGFVSIRIMTIDPVIAKYWLENLNTNNRPLKETHLRSLIADFDAGRYQLNTDSIGFDVDGTLINGQHRLTAIAHTGITVQVPVMTGLPKEAVNVIDGNRPRTVADVMKISGMAVPHRNNMAAVATHLHLLLRNDNAKFSADRTMEVLKRIDRVAEVVNECCSKQHTKWSPFVVPMVALTLTEGVDSVLSFIKQVQDPIGYEGKTDPRFVVNKMLTGKHSHSDIRDTMLKFLRGYRYWKSGLKAAGKSLKPEHPEFLGATMGAVEAVLGSKVDVKDVEGYELLHSEECWGKEFFGLKIFVKMSKRKIDRDDGYEEGAYQAINNLKKALQTRTARLDPEGPPKRGRLRSQVVDAYAAAGAGVVFVEEVPNEYCSDPCCFNVPWFRVTSSIGHVKVGWRKSVLAVDWKDSVVKKTADELFPAEDVTKGGSMIHAHGLAKLVEYLRRLHQES